MLQGAVGLSLFGREAFVHQTQIIEWPDCADARPEHRAGREIQISEWVDRDAELFAQVACSIDIAEPCVAGKRHASVAFRVHNAQLWCRLHDAKDPCDTLRRSEQRIEEVLSPGVELAACVK